jgi:hypothetical protein
MAGHREPVFLAIRCTRWLGKIVSAALFVLSQGRLACSAVICWPPDLLLKQKRDKPLSPPHVYLILLAEMIQTLGFVILCGKK